MTARDWLTLALRVLGIVLLIRAVEVIAYLTVMLAGNAVSGLFGSGVFEWHFAIVYAIASGVPAVFNTALAIGLVMYAPAIAQRFYPGETAVGNAASVRDIYEVGARLLGLYALLLAVPSLGRVVSSFFTEWPYGNPVRLSLPVPADNSTHVVTFGLYLVFAGWLLLGARRWAAIFARLHYHPQPSLGPSEADTEHDSPSAGQSGKGNSPLSDDR